MKISTGSINRKNIFGCLLILLFAGISTGAMAVEFYGGAHGVTASGVSGATSMRIAGPRGFVIEVDSLSYSSAEGLPNGSYRYEIVGETVPESNYLDSKAKMNNGRSEHANNRSRRCSKKTNMSWCKLSKIDSATKGLD